MVMSLTNPHTIRGRPTLKDVEWFQLKLLISLEQLITSVVEKKNNLHEQNFEVYLENQDRGSGIHNQGSRIGLKKT